jgi:prepilin-type N-terminal cleavage/methylation domain-containing protein
MIRAIKNKKGFSLIETLVASAILSGAVLTLGAISTMSVSSTRLNRQYEVAASLLDKQLSLIDFVGIDEFIDLGQMEGVFEGYEPTYHWEVVTEYQDIDSLYLVQITISWIDGNRPYSISAETMLDGVSVYIEVEI